MKNLAQNRELKVVIELMLYGLFIRTGQLGSILLALQFDEIFTNPTQLVFLFPVAIAVIIVLITLTFIEVECNSYAEKLDQRLEAVNLYFTQSSLISQRGYLQKTFLQVILNILALPALAIFLGWTSSLLFLVLIASISCSAAVIFRYNKLHIRKSSKGLKAQDAQSLAKKKHHQGKVPFYIINNINSGQYISEEEKFIGLNDSNQRSSISQLTGVRKRKFLNLIRQASRIIILVAAVVLVIFKVTSIVKVAGFLIIGNFFRSGCISLFEFMSSTDKLFPISESLRLIERSLLKVGLLEEKLFKTYEKTKELRIEFNRNYSSIISNHPFFRVKNLTVRDIDGRLIIANMTSRIQLKPLTYLYIDGITLTIGIKEFLATHMTGKSSTNFRYLINGEALIGGKKLSNNFFHSISIYNPKNTQISSNDIFNYFEPKSANELKSLLDNSQELKLLIDSVISENVPIEMLSQRQINQAKSIIELLRLYLEPCCVSVSMFIFDYFEESDAIFLIEIFSSLYQKKDVNLIIFGRNKLSLGLNMSYYKLTSDSIRKMNSNGK